MNEERVFRYDIEAADDLVRRTNYLLRTMNAVRLTAEDFKRVWREPTLSNIMWTLVQVTRTWNNLRRLINIVTSEADEVFTLTRGVTRKPPRLLPSTPEKLSGWID